MYTPKTYATHPKTPSRHRLDTPRHHTDTHRNKHSFALDVSIMTHDPMKILPADFGLTHSQTPSDTIQTPQDANQTPPDKDVFMQERALEENAIFQYCELL